MELPVKVAFCKILFWKYGGRFSENGLPILVDGVRGRCDIAWDCASCSYLREWVEYVASQSWTVGWECISCLRDTYKVDDAEGRMRNLPGFFSAGRDPSLPPETTFSGEVIESDPDRPALTGCTRCGHQTSFLQLVLRR